MNVDKVVHDFIHDPNLIANLVRAVIGAVGRTFGPAGERALCVIIAYEVNKFAPDLFDKEALVKALFDKEALVKARKLAEEMANESIDAIDGGMDAREVLKSDSSSSCQ